MGETGSVRPGLFIEKNGYLSGLSREGLAVTRVLSIVGLDRASVWGQCCSAQKKHGKSHDSVLEKIWMMSHVFWMRGDGGAAVGSLWLSQ
jgi:hypothetical protein